MAEGVEVFLRAYDATRTRVRTAVDATQAEVADVGFAASAAAVQEEELRSATEGRDVAVARREELAWRLETLQLRNEELLKRKAEDLKKIQTLERLAGPCLQHIVYEHGRKPEIIGWTGRGHGAGVPVIMSKYRNRAVEGEVRQLDGEIEVMKAKIAKQREGWVEEVQGLRTAFATEHDASHEQLLALHARRQESQTLHAALLKQLVTSRTEAFEREENLLRSSAALKAELAEVNETLAKQRQRRASDMAAVLNSAKAETRSTTLSLAEERAEQAAREADVLKTAEEKRARDDKKIAAVTSKLDRLVRQCKRLASAKHFEMEGLASEVGIVRNDLKMLECFLSSRRGQREPGAVDPAGQDHVEMVTTA